MNKLFKSIGVLSLLLFLLLTATWIHFNEEILVLDDAARKSAVGQFVELEYGKVHYEIGGPADGEWVVLVHGFSVPSYIWDPTFELLTSAGYRVLRYDLYGRGYSDRPGAEYTMEFFARQLDQLTDELGVSGPFRLVGLSMGGAVSAAFSNRHAHKVDRLVLIDPLVVDTPDDEIFPLDVPLLGTYLATVYLVPQLISGQTTDFLEPERFSDWEARFRTQIRYRGFRDAIHSTVVNLPHANLAGEYSKLGQSSKPVQVFWGREDRTLPLEHSEVLLERVTQAELTIIEKAGHLPHFERPEVFNPVLLEVLR